MWRIMGLWTVSIPHCFVVLCLLSPRSLVSSALKWVLGCVDDDADLVWFRRNRQVDGHGAAAHLAGPAGACLAWAEAHELLPPGGH